VTHRFWVAAAQIEADEVAFSAPQLHQIRDVLRLRAGDQVRIFDGAVFEDRLVELVEPGRGRVVGLAAQPPEPRTRLFVYPALLQRDKFETILQKLTEIGAAAIGPLVTERSLVRSAPDERRLERWTAIVREAAEQCGRGSIPALLPTTSLVSALQACAGTRIVAYERERSAGLREALAGRPACVDLFVGPEGGFSDEEAASARGAGAALVSLGPRVLRSETASPLAAALVLYELGDLSMTA
jgi:16S rRNA (uracil1498-N3)-methyltransferase